MLLSDPLTLTNDFLQVYQSSNSPVRSRVMAQALFDEHPLEQYLRDAGEAADFMPGSSAEFALELDPHVATESEITSKEVKSFEWRPIPLARLAKIAQYVIPAHQSSIPRSFVERFKYDVISSSLLAPALPQLTQPSPRRTSHSPATPGKLKANRPAVARLGIHNHPSRIAFEKEIRYWLLGLAVGVVGLLSSAGFHFLAVLLACGSLILMYRFRDRSSAPDLTPCLDSLNQLIASNDNWEAVVSDTLRLLETDEQRSATYGAFNPSPSVPLRATLYSTLVDLQSQCDNVRNLFSALASPSELAQISEMYAPPSPKKSLHILPDNFSAPRKLSMNGKRRDLRSASPIPRDSKRSTWNGGSPFTTPPSRRERHQSDLSSLRALGFPGIPTSPKSTSAPVTPNPVGHPSLPEVQEEDSPPQPGYDSESFGPGALSMRKSRRSLGAESLGKPNRPPRSPNTPGSAFSSSSRRTSHKAGRHPQTLASLQSALQGAVSSRRYTCSHLLALRFAGEEDAGYWEDVRSMMSLLATTFSEAAAQLAASFEDLERQRLMEENPTPKFTPPKLEEDKNDFDKQFITPAPAKRPSKLASVATATAISFAPTMTHLSRFAIHIETISTSLEDAKTHLEECVAALKEENEAQTPQPASPPSHSRQSTDPSTSVDFPSASPPLPTSNRLVTTEESKALQAYDRLRRELGLALRECERGKEKLLDIIFSQQQSQLASYDADPDSDASDTLPGLGHDALSDDSDKGEDGEDMPPVPDIRFRVIAPDAGTQHPAVIVEHAAAVEVDDATKHLLVTASAQHLPSPGIEQVYEAETPAAAAALAVAGEELVGIFERERSKLTREERIKLIRAQRAVALSTDSERRHSSVGGGNIADDSASGSGSSSSSGSLSMGAGIGIGMGMEKWGPSGDVVQELKDVIWKVGERRRRMTVEAMRVQNQNQSLSKVQTETTRRPLSE